MSTTPIPPARYARDFPELGPLRVVEDPGGSLKGLVIRGPFSFCAYAGVPVDHALAELEELELDCHHGITFRGMGDGELRPAGYFWYGWDYGHCTDVLVMPPGLTRELPPSLRETVERLEQLMANTGFHSPFKSKDWTIEEVEQDVVEVMVVLREQLLHTSTVTASLVKLVTLAGEAESSVPQAAPEEPASGGSSSG